MALKCVHLKIDEILASSLLSVLTVDYVLKWPKKIMTSLYDLTFPYMLLST